MTEPIRSPRNPRLALVAALRRASRRRELGLTLLEGPHLLKAAVEAGVVVREVFALAADRAAAALAERAGKEVATVSPEVLERVAPTEHPRGPLAVVEIPPPGILARDSLLLAVSDPGNAGTLLRTAAAFGLDVGFAAGSVDPWAPKVLRAGAGAHFHTTVSTGPPPPGLGLIATVVAGGVPPDTFDRVLSPGRSWGVMVGNEAHGLDPVELEAADVRVTIPMPGGTESLNAAVAGSIVAYELSSWRRRAGR